MKIVFTFSYETYYKDNTKNYTTNYNILVFVIRVKIFFCLLFTKTEGLLCKTPPQRKLCTTRNFQEKHKYNKQYS